jgi:hypothetical protein
LYFEIWIVVDEYILFIPQRKLWLPKSFYLIIERLIRQKKSFHLFLLYFIFEKCYFKTFFLTQYIRSDNFVIFFLSIFSFSFGFSLLCMYCLRKSVSKYHFSGWSTLGWHTFGKENCAPYVIHRPSKIEKYSPFWVEWESEMSL